MARETALDLVTNVRVSCGGETTETLSDARILRTINQEIQRIISKYKVLQMEDSTTITTAADTAEYELSVSDIMTLNTLTDSTNGLKLEVMDRDQYEDYTGSTTATGRPVYWMVSGVGSNDRWNITFYPTPAGVYTINVYYSKIPTELVLEPTPTSTYLPEPWDSIIEWRSAAKCWAILHDVGMSTHFMKMANEEEKAASKITEYSSTIRKGIKSIAGIS